MNNLDLGAIAAACENAIPRDDHQALLQNLQRLLPDVSLKWAYTGPSWYKVGGIVDGEGGRVAERLRPWVEENANGDLFNLIEEFGDQDLFVTRHVGRTHYLVGPRGEQTLDFVQVEVEEIQEIIDRPLFDEKWVPMDLEDLIDPLEYPKAEPKPLAHGRYSFKEVRDIATATPSEQSPTSDPVFLRFVKEWNGSSASSSTAFCDAWVLSFNNYIDGFGVQRTAIRPVTTFVGSLPELPEEGIKRGSSLARFIHEFDRAAGFPMAWYFFMLTSHKSFHKIAEAVHGDLMGAYDYLPVRDLAILKKWMSEPYCF